MFHPVHIQLNIGSLIKFDIPYVFKNIVYKEQNTSCLLTCVHCAV